MSEGKLQADIVAYLASKLASGAVADDDKESLEIALDCIKETFAVKTAPSTEGLLAIYNRGLNPMASTTNASGSDDKKPTTLKNEAAVSAEVKAEADALKAKGNKLMAARDFAAAADAYTNAIAKDSTNALYFSNRAAAYSHLSLHSKAADDARRATELDPKYSKAWSRLGLALWALGDLKGSKDAYENGLKAEGDHPSEAMKRDFENVQRRYSEEIAKQTKSSQDAVSKAASASSDASADAGAGMGGFDFSKIGEVMKNPMFQKMAQGLMSDPEALSNLMNSPMAQQAKEQFGKGGMPDLSSMMNDPNIQNMMKDFGK